MKPQVVRQLRPPSEEPLSHGTADPLRKAGNNSISEPQRPSNKADINQTAKTGQDFFQDY